MTFSEKFLQLDGNILIGIQHTLGADWLTYVMKGLTFLAEAGWFWILLCFVLMAFKKTRRIGIICAVSLAFEFCLCNGVIKILVDRARPWEVLEGVKMLIPDPGDSSFPSAHTSASFATAWALWLSTRKGWPKLHRWSFVAIALALLIGFSRMYLGMHFPSDVLAGLLIGLICATIVYIIFTKYDKKNDTIIVENFSQEK